MLRRRCLTGFCALAGLHMLPRAVQAEGMLSRASEGVQVPVYDVVVVGTGLAGHCAALSAKLAGAQRVMMIDKAPLVGGHSALASGSILVANAGRAFFAEYFPRLRWYASSMRHSVRKHGSPTLYLPIA